MRKYTVWVGGVEATDHLLTKQEAIEVVKHYLELGYDDVKAIKTKCHEK